MFPEHNTNRKLINYLGKLNPYSYYFSVSYIQSTKKSLSEQAGVHSLLAEDTRKDKKGLKSSLCLMVIDSLNGPDRPGHNNPLTEYWRDRKLLLLYFVH